MEKYGFKRGKLALEVWTNMRFLMWKISVGSVEHDTLKCGKLTLKMWKNALLNLENRRWKCGKLGLEMWKMDL